MKFGNVMKVYFVEVKIYLDSLSTYIGPLKLVVTYLHLTCSVCPHKYFPIFLSSFMIQIGYTILTKAILNKNRTCIWVTYRSTTASIPMYS